MTEQEARLQQSYDVSLRIRFHHDEPLYLNETVGLLSGISSLIWIAAASHNLDTYTNQQLLASEATGELRTKMLHAPISAGNGYSDFTAVQKLSHNSPFEIILIIIGVAGAVPPVLNKFISTYNNFQDARAKKAHTDLNVLATEMLTEQLRAIRQDGTYEDLAAVLPSVQGHVEAAAAALPNVSEIEPITSEQ